MPFREKKLGVAAVVASLLLSVSGWPATASTLGDTVVETAVAQPRTMAEAARIGEAEALARWKAFPRYGRRCRLGTERASLRIGPKIVLHQIRWDAGMAGPEAVAYADLHAGDRQAQEKEFADTIRRSCSKALRAEPLSGGIPGGCRASCPNRPDPAGMSDLEFVTACFLCRVEGAAIDLALRIRRNGLGEGYAPQSVETLAGSYLRGQFGQSLAKQRKVREKNGTRPARPSALRAASLAVRRLDTGAPCSRNHGAVHATPWWSSSRALLVLERAVGQEVVLDCSACWIVEGRGSPVSGMPGSVHQPDHSTSPVTTTWSAKDAQSRSQAPQLPASS